jgi:hypothetical protein
MPITPEMQKQSPPLIASKNTKDCFELIGNKAVSYGGKSDGAWYVLFFRVCEQRANKLPIFPIYMK